MKTIDYTFYHWGPFLYKTSLTKEEIKNIKKLCSKKSKDHRKDLAGLIKHEHSVDKNKLFPIIFPYIDSYAKAYINYSGKIIGSKIELISSWVNYMTKFESNPVHTHDGELSFVIFTDIPKGLNQEWEETISAGSKPGNINFIISLDNHNKLFIHQQSFKPCEGDFFIFPASLPHFVNSFTSEGERVSISGNLTVK